MAAIGYADPVVNHALVIVSLSRRCKIFVGTFLKCFFCTLLKMFLGRVSGWVPLVAMYNVFWGIIFTHLVPEPAIVPTHSPTSPYNGI